MSDKILDLGHALRAYLSGKEYFSNASASTPKVIPVVCEDMGDIDTRIETALSAGGIIVIIRMLGGKIPSKDNGSPIFNPAIYRFRTYENPARNRTSGGTQQCASKVAGAIERLLWTFHQQVAGYDPVTPVDRAWGAENGMPFYDVLCETVVATDSADPTRDESLVTEAGASMTTEGRIPLNA